MPKLKLLLDENIGQITAVRLRKAGYDVLSILADSPGISDKEVLERARREKRIVVTLDHDFGALIFRDSKKHIGVLLLRLKKESSENITQTLLKVLEYHGDKLANKFTIASEWRVRIHP